MVFNLLFSLILRLLALASCFDKELPVLAKMSVTKQQEISRPWPSICQHQWTHLRQLKTLNIWKSSAATCFEQSVWNDHNTIWIVTKSKVAHIYCNRSPEFQSAVHFTLKVPSHYCDFSCNVVASCGRSGIACSLPGVVLRSHKPAIVVRSRTLAATRRIGVIVFSMLKTIFWGLRSDQIC